MDLNVFGGAGLALTIVAFVVVYAVVMFDFFTQKKHKAVLRLVGVLSIGIAASVVSYFGGLYVVSAVILVAYIHYVSKVQKFCL
ncbi:hypothetical protein HC723_15675 [Vibrio sp. S11_S32]|uniref:hypothetical protein n=1 Tax=Vibrio sp. S11_S32 TaxID=2720225 RepID=UPI00168074BC|nr:hypothetical protein [Vibrio sp. S11_S32]MBD1577837.1 hypothetical protein [Vibrio sp. S11_S32]